MGAQDCARSSLNYLIPKTLSPNPSSDGRILNRVHRFACYELRGDATTDTAFANGGNLRRYWPVLIWESRLGDTRGGPTVPNIPMFLTLTALFVRAYSANRRANATPTSDWRGGSAPARPHVKAAQVEANDSARRSSSAVSCASGPVLIRPMARKANNSAA
jgi:hypothetical protein